jgi:hypothetical protein
MEFNTLFKDYNYVSDQLTMNRIENLTILCDNSDIKHVILIFVFLKRFRPWTTNQLIQLLVN